LKSPQRERETILASSNCIPCTMPYATSPFLVRAMGDRPQPVPVGSRNLGLLGQYVELADEVALTVEYSVRSAQQAVYALCKVPRPMPPVRVDEQVPDTTINRMLESVAGA